MLTIRTIGYTSLTRVVNRALMKEAVQADFRGVGGRRATEAGKTPGDTAGSPLLVRGVPACATNCNYAHQFVPYSFAFEHMSDIGSMLLSKIPGSCLMVCNGEQSSSSPPPSLT